MALGFGRLLMLNFFSLQEYKMCSCFCNDQDKVKRQEPSICIPLSVKILHYKKETVNYRKKQNYDHRILVFIPTSKDLLPLP